jgi:uncharacterized protein (TIGR00375 family)
MFIADFHIHSQYSRATSRECVPEMLELWARRKGLGLIGTGDFTHPAWRAELKEKLVAAEEGLYVLKDDFRREDRIAGASLQPRFIVSGEISSIYKKNGKVRKVHNLIVLPGLEAAEALARRLEAIGNVHSDGRPILGLDSKDLLEITLETAPQAIFIPAHIWTPHFSVLGAYSGFDDIRECFEDLSGHIHALETGLSSDPPMNWRLSALDQYTLVSNSDAHSPANLAREANLFETTLSFPHIARALANRESGEFGGTIEFFPEEGKYHYDGHRNCKVCLKPAETRDAGGICRVCGGRITVGVLHRVEELADRREGFIPPAAQHFESLVPLAEVIAASIGMTTASAQVKEKYADLISNLGAELYILRQAPPEDIELKAGPLVAEGIKRLRSGNVEVLPGYDGEYGKVKILDRSEIDRLSGQLGFFNKKEKKERQTRLKSELPKEKTLPKGRKNQGPGLVKKEEGLLAENPEAWAGLNSEQKEAVIASEPVVAVIAGPGTGKTRTLVSRIAYLTEKRGVPPSQIMAVTFTNRAAAEMRTRLLSQMGDRQAAEALTIGTFHSIGLNSLVRTTEKAALTVIDEYQALAILQEVLAGLQVQETAREILKRISLIKSGVSPESEKCRLPPGVYAAYCARLEQYAVLDYDDILLKTLQLLEERQTAGRPENHRPENNRLKTFTHILVDEFQDINATQYRLIKEWGRGSAGIFVIGDQDQSIYGFRGSDAACFRRLREDFPRLREIRLTQNYRSTPEIVGCALTVIAKTDQAGNCHTLEAKRPGGNPVRLLAAHDDFSEALCVAKEINRLVGGIDMLDAHRAAGPRRKKTGASPVRGFADVAILYRTNRQSQILEQCLAKEGIPYVVAGREDFLSDPEVRQAVAFFRFLLNPTDLVSLGSCLRAMGVGPAGFLQGILQDYAVSEKNSAALSEIIQPRVVKSSGRAQEFLALLKIYRPRITRESPSSLIESWISDNGQKESRSLELLLNTAVMYAEMPVFMHYLLLGRESDIRRSGGRQYNPETVSLMTLHGAKGLEFPVVFLCGVKDGLIPLKDFQGADNRAEEGRLFYVGLTRAQDELILLAPGVSSPFLAGISANIVHMEQALESRKPAGFEQLSLFGT